MEHALVLGGSVAGLLAARVLSDHTAEVVIVERDDLATGWYGRCWRLADQLQQPPEVSEIARDHLGRRPAGTQARP